MWMKAKIIDKNDQIIVKALFNSYMADREEAKVKKIKSDFITHIIAKVDNVKIYEAHTSGFVSKQPRIEFKVKKSLYGKTIKFIIVDNNGYIKSKSFKIEKSTTKKLKMESENKLLFQNQRTNKPKVWEYKTSKEAIKAFYGSLEHNNTGIDLELTDSFIQNDITYANQMDRVNIKITSSIDLDSIGIFVDGNQAATQFEEHSSPRSTVAIFVIPEEGIIDYDITIKLKGSSDITIIGKNKNGNLHKVSKSITSFISTTSGD